MAKLCYEWLPFTRKNINVILLINKLYKTKSPKKAALYKPWNQKGENVSKESEKTSKIIFKGIK